MSEAFDKEAGIYDDVFTNSPIGIYQRQQVFHHLKKSIAINKIKDVFEVNCGTGIDALTLNGLNCNVTATDISSEMIDIANSKSNHEENSGIRFMVMNAIDIANFAPPFSIDLVFSNFGGLNCLSPLELRSFLFNTHKVLKKNGRIILVLISKKCVWERFYYLLKGKKFRRNTSKAVKAKLEKATFNIWYYSKKEIEKMAFEKFRLEKIRPIGMFVPPSYLNSFFKRHSRLLSYLASIDKLLKDFSFFGNYADHIYIELKKK